MTTQSKINEAVNSMNEAIAELEAAKNQAYFERNQLVVHLSYIYPSYLARHDKKDSKWEDDWRWIVVIYGPKGQMSWHIHDSEIDMFNHLSINREYKWDGHTTMEKYARLKAIHDKEFTQTIHLCTSCSKDFPECNANEDDITYSSETDDAIICCNCYSAKELVDTSSTDLSKVEAIKFLFDKPSNLDIKA